MIGEIPDRAPDQVLRSKRNGVILEINVPGLMKAIGQSEVIVAMVPAVGDFIPTGGVCCTSTASSTSRTTG